LRATLVPTSASSKNFYELDQMILRLSLWVCNGGGGTRPP